MANELHRRYRWFRRQTHTAREALVLTRDEQWLFEQDDVERVTESDWDPDLSWMTDDERRQEHTVEVYALVRPCADHGRQCRHTEWLTSVCNVVDADQNYARVLFAELATELMAE